MATAQESRCPNCKGTNRSKYIQPVESLIRGQEADGTPFDTVIWRKCQCSDCGQWRTVRTYELRNPPKQNN